MHRYRVPNQGRPALPDNIAICIHDVQLLLREIQECTLRWMMLNPSYATMIDMHVMQRYFIREYLSKNFGYTMVDHITHLEPYKTIYQQILNYRPRLAHALRWHNHGIYGDTPVTMGLINDSLVLIYPREQNEN